MIVPKPRQRQLDVALFAYEWHITVMKILPFAALLLLSAVLASCNSADSSRSSHSSLVSVGGRTDKLSGNNSLTDVSVKTGANGVAMAGTTVDGRRLKSTGRNTDQAVDNLGNAALKSR